MLESFKEQFKQSRRVNALTKTCGGILDDEIKPTPKAFWPPGVTAGPINCGPNALPHPNEEAAWSAVERKLKRIRNGRKRRPRSCGTNH